MRWHGGKHTKKLITAFVAGLLLIVFGLTDIQQGYQARSSVFNGSCGEYLRTGGPKMIVNVTGCQVLPAEAVARAVRQGQNDPGEVEAAMLPLYAQGNTSGPISAVVYTRDSRVVAAVSALLKEQQNAVRYRASGGSGSISPALMSPVPLNLVGVAHTEEVAQSYDLLLSLTKRFPERFGKSATVIYEGGDVPSMSRGFGITIAGLVVWLCSIPFLLGRPLDASSASASSSSRLMDLLEDE